MTKTNKATQKKIIEKQPLLKKKPNMYLLKVRCTVNHLSVG